MLYFLELGRISFGISWIVTVSEAISICLFVSNLKRFLVSNSFTRSSSMRGLNLLRDSMIDSIEIGDYPRSRFDRCKFARALDRSLVPSGVANFAWRKIRASPNKPRIF